MKVRFSVLMPVYNRAKYVRQAIDSLLSQTFSNFELFAIDDGSTDGTLEVLESYGTRIRVIRQVNQGPEVARNNAAAIAEGEYLALLDSDDLLLPCALETYDRIIRSCDSPPLIIGSMTYFEEGQSIPAQTQAPRPVELLTYPDYLSKGVSVGLSSSRIVIRKSLFDEVGGLRNSTPETFHLDDFNLVLKTGTCGPCIFVQRPCTVAYRKHDTNSIRNPKALVDGILALIRTENKGQYPGGQERRWARYACIGGIAATWIKYSWNRGFKKLAVQLLLGSSPMVFAAVCKKIAAYARKSAPPMVLPDP